MTDYNKVMEEVMEHAKTTGNGYYNISWGKDMVNSPDHYKNNPLGIECIKAIEASMSPEEFKGYLKGNAMKYIWRYTYKQKPKEDLQKAEYYLKALIERV